MFKRLRSDIQCILDRDPAARSKWEVVTCYPGLHALVLHRGAHWLWRMDHRENEKSHPGGDPCYLIAGLLQEFKCVGWIIDADQDEIISNQDVATLKIERRLGVP